MIETPRLRLSVLAPGDRAAFCAFCAQNAAHLAPWSPASADPLDVQFDRALERATRGLADGTQVRLYARLHDGTPAGFFALSEIVRGAFQNAYASWSVDATLCGRGLAREGVGALLDLGFGPLGLHRVQANIIPENAASVRVAERCGFRREGLARAYLHIAGRWQDHWMYARLAEEHAL